MAYLEVHQALREHRKVIDLAARLEMPEAHVVGHCVYLWLWALDNCPDGRLTIPDPVIERIAGWVGERGALAAAMTAVGLLDRDADGVRQIHDWWQYAGRLIERRQADAERKRQARRGTVAHPETPGERDDRARGVGAMPDGGEPAADGPADDPADDPADGGGTAHVPNRTVPQRTVPQRSAAQRERAAPVGQAAGGFSPAHPALGPERLAAHAAAVGTTADKLAAILPQWADARLGAGRQAADWEADLRKFARSFLEQERAPSRAGAERATTRAPSTDKYTRAAVADSLAALDALVGGAGDAVRDVPGGDGTAGAGVRRATAGTPAGVLGLAAGRRG